MPDCSHFNQPGNQRDGLDEETTDWRAVCGKTARAVRREGSAKADPYPYHDDVRRGHAVDTQGCNQRQCFPMTMRNFVDEAFTHRRPAVEPRHLRRDRRLVEEDEAGCLQFRLLSLELRPCCSNIRSILRRVEDTPAA